MTDILINRAQEAEQDLSRLQLAFERQRGVLQSMPAEGLKTINVHIPTVYARATAVLLRLRELRADLLAMPLLDKTLIEGVEDFLLALGYAQALHQAASTPPDSIPGLYKELLEVRAYLLADAAPLAKRGLISAEKLKELRGPVSPTGTAFDMLALVAVLRANWAQIQHKSAIDMSELQRAETTAEALLAAVGVRDLGVVDKAYAATMRQAAFTKFDQAYNELRRGVAHLRWHEGDADELAPSLYSVRIGRRPNTRKRKAAEELPLEASSDAASTSAPDTSAPASRESDLQLKASSGRAQSEVQRRLQKKSVMRRIFSFAQASVTTNRNEPSKETGEGHVRHHHGSNARHSVHQPYAGFLSASLSRTDRDAGGAADDRHARRQSGVRTRLRGAGQGAALSQRHPGADGHRS